MDVTILNELCETNIFTSGISVEMSIVDEYTEMKLQKTHWIIIFYILAYKSG